MEIEKLIKHMREEAQDYRSGRTLGRAFADAEDILDEAATALSMLQAENEKLRAELEYEKEHANAYYEECGQWEVENAQLKAKLEAFRRERDSIEQNFRAFAKQWWEEDSGFPCRWCKFENSGGCEWKARQPDEEKICAGRAFEWRG